MKKIQNYVGIKLHSIVVTTRITNEKAHMVFSS